MNIKAQNETLILMSDCGHGNPGSLPCGSCMNPGEFDPTGANPHEPGAKLDAGKAPIMRGVIGYFPNALAAVAEVSDFGARKYTWGGWRSVPDGHARYSDAMMRHIVKECSEGAIDDETNLTHAAHAAWNALARLELMLGAKP